MCKRRQSIQASWRSTRPQKEEEEEERKNINPKTTNGVERRSETSVFE